MPNQPVKQTEQWPRVALRRELYDKLKKRAEGINTTIADLLALEEREIARADGGHESRITRPRERMGGWLDGGRSHRHAGRAPRTERARAVDRDHCT